MSSSKSSRYASTRSPRPESKVGLTPTLTAAGPLPEAEVLADRNPRRAERPDQDVLHELLGAPLLELAIEVDDHQVVDPESGDHVALDVERHQQLGHGVGADHRHRVRLEGEYGVASVDHRSMPQVDAVEGPDRDLSTTIRRWLELVQRRDVHGTNTTNGLSAPSSAGRAIARSAPS